MVYILIIQGCYQAIASVQGTGFVMIFARICEIGCAKLLIIQHFSLETWVWSSELQTIFLHMDVMHYCQSFLLSRQFVVHNVCISENWHNL